MAAKFNSGDWQRRSRSSGARRSLPPPAAGLVEPAVSRIGLRRNLPHLSGPRRELPLQPQPVLGRFGKAGDTDLAARQTDVAQLTVGEAPQDRQVGLLLALRDERGDRVVDGAKDAAAKN